MVTQDHRQEERYKENKNQGDRFNIIASLILMRVVVKNIFRFEPLIRGCSGVSLFESGQFPSLLVGGIMHGMLQPRHTATPPMRLRASL